MAKAKMARNEKIAEIIKAGDRRVACSECGNDGDSSVYRVRTPDEEDVVLCMGCLDDAGEMYAPGEIAILKIYQHEEDWLWLEGPPPKIIEQAAAKPQKVEKTRKK